MDFDRRETVLVNTEIGNMNSEDDQSLQELFCQLGKAYFEGAYEDPLPQLLPLFDEISEILKKPVGTVKSRIHYAKEALAQQLKEEERHDRS